MLTGSVTRSPPVVTTVRRSSPDDADTRAARPAVDRWPGDVDRFVGSARGRSGRSHSRAAVRCEKATSGGSAVAKVSSMRRMSPGLRRTASPRADAMGAGLEVGGAEANLGDPVRMRRRRAEGLGPQGRGRSLGRRLTEPSCGRSRRLGRLSTGKPGYPQDEGCSWPGDVTPGADIEDGKWLEWGRLRAVAPCIAIFRRRTGRTAGGGAGGLGGRDHPAGRVRDWAGARTGTGRGTGGDSPERGERYGP